jgi:hypothetical protein
MSAPHARGQEGKKKQGQRLGGSFLENAENIMGKITYRGWQHTADDAPQPIGIVFEQSLRKQLGKYGASDARQDEFARRYGTDVVITPRPLPPPPGQPRRSATPGAAAPLETDADQAEPSDNTS